MTPSNPGSTTQRARAGAGCARRAQAPFPTRPRAESSIRRFSRGKTLKKLDSGYLSSIPVAGLLFAVPCFLLPLSFSPPPQHSPARLNQCPVVFRSMIGNFMQATSGGRLTRVMAKQTLVLAGLNTDSSSPEILQRPLLLMYPKLQPLLPPVALKILS